MAVRAIPSIGVPERENIMMKDDLTKNAFRRSGISTRKTPV